MIFAEQVIASGFIAWWILINEMVQPEAMIAFPVKCPIIDISGNGFFII
jgi:hypothetical protein